MKLVGCLAVEGKDEVKEQEVKVLGLLCLRPKMS